MRPTISLTVAAALLLSIAGCSKLKNTEWLDMERGWRVKLASKTAIVEDPVLGRRETMLAEIHKDRDVMLIDTNLGFLGGRDYVTFALDGEQMRSQPWSDVRMRLVPANEATEKEFASLIQRKTFAHESRQLPLPASDKDYIRLSQRDVALIVATHRTSPHQAGRGDAFGQAAGMFRAGYHREMGDEDLAAAFIPGYGAERDTFKRAEMLELVPSIRERMETLRGRGDIRFSLDSPAPVVPILAYSTPGRTSLGAYHLQTNSFTFTNEMSPCTDADSLRFPYQVYRAPIGLMDWVTDESNHCRIQIDDLDLAKQIEAARVANRLRIETDVYFRLTGEMVNNERFGLTPVFEVHKVQVSMREIQENGKAVALGPAEGFTITPVLKVPRNP